MVSVRSSSYGRTREVARHKKRVRVRRDDSRVRIQLGEKEMKDQSSVIVAPKRKHFGLYAIDRLFL